MSAKKRAAPKKGATPKQPRVVKPAAPAIQGADLIPVRYIASKANPETDVVMKLDWTNGVVRSVPRPVAEQLVWWSDTWADARDPEEAKKSPLVAREWRPTFQQDEIDKLPVLMPLQSMDAKALQQYSVMSFNEHLPDNMPVETMRTEIMRFMTRPM